MSDHRLVVTRGPDHYEDQDDFEFTIQCLDPEACEGFISCHEEHPGADPSTETALFHGVTHTYRPGHGFWSVPYDGCIVAWGLDGSGVDSAHDIATLHGFGTHDVDADWDDFGLVLHHVATLEGVHA